MTEIKDKPEVKLPLFGYVGKLEPLPGQDPSRTFAVANNITPAPEGSAGYLVELTGKRRCKILAWLRGGGDAFACDAPLIAKPERDAEVYMRLDAEEEHQGSIWSRLTGEDYMVARVQQFPENNLRKALVNPASNLGPYANRQLDNDDALAVAFLAFYQLPLERGEKNPWETMADVLGRLTDVPYPDALDALMYRGSKQGASGFERFAAQELMAVGAERVRTVAAQHQVDLRRLSSTRLFWTAYRADELSEDEIDLLQATEGVLNRLALLDLIVTDDDGSPKLATVREETCRIASGAVLARFLNAAPGRMRGLDENPFATVFGASCARGGEWDTRTRFAHSAETLKTPMGFRYSFDCDARQGLFEIHTSLPAELAFPTVGARTPAQTRSSYALRLATLLASTAFGSGVGIVNVRVVLHERTESGPTVLSLTLKRPVFAMSVIPAIDRGELQEEELTFDELLAVLEPTEHEYALNDSGGLEHIEVKPSMLGPRPRMANDTRELPEGLAERLHADRVCDLDIYDASDDTLRDRYAEVAEGCEPGSPESLSGLADIISAYDAADLLQDDTLAPLYCDNMVSRVLAGSACDPTAHPGERVRFRKLPDTAYNARSALARCLREVRNFEDSIRLSTELTHLAPTSFGSWHSLALGYAESDQFEKSAEALVEGLKVASSTEDAFVAYYRLGFAFWQTGDAPLGLACYAMIHPRSRFGAQAAEEMGDLMKEARISSAPTRSAAEAILRSNGIPIAPVNAVRELAAQAAIDLVDGGFLNAGENLTLFLSSQGCGPNGSDVLQTVSRSLAAKD